VIPSPALDLFPMLAAALAAVSCALLGNFLVLRRLSLMGDAISHSVLPGLVVAFLVSNSRAPGAMFLGAAVAGMATVALVEVVKRLGRVEPGAAMGVVFSVLFALGVLLIERAAVRHVDLDAGCVLYGQLETLIWYDGPARWAPASLAPALAATPRQVWMLVGACAMAVVLVVGLFKELRLAAFDPGLATALGFNATILHALLMGAVALATVAAFEAVGSILVIAMLVCPAATCRLLTDRLCVQVWLSVGVALLTALGGYWAATGVPALVGAPSVNAAGAMATTAGLLLAVAVVAAPRYGVVGRLVRSRALARATALEDLLAALYRREERRDPAAAQADAAGLDGLGLACAPRVARAARARGLRRGLLARSGAGLALTGTGRARAADVVRRHRLWEAYLVDRAGLAPDHVHEPAERLEHVAPTPPAPRGPSDGDATAPRDPHGRPIPPRERQGERD